MGKKTLAAGGELEPVRGLANKLPEHAARIAAVLTLVNDIEAGEVGPAEMDAGIAVAQHYAGEALRLFGASRMRTTCAKRSNCWDGCTRRGPMSSCCFPDTYQRGPHSIRDGRLARSAVTTLEEHGWLVRAPAGYVNGTFRHEVWKIVRG